jgi:hypothetical protein
MKKDKSRKDYIISIVLYSISFIYLVYTAYCDITYYESMKKKESKMIKKTAECLELKKDLEEELYGKAEQKIE